jgi:O-antigen/teichoic acid export membrane protein
LQSSNEHRRIVVLTARMMRKVAALCFPLYFFLLVNSREFILVLFTERYVESWPVFAISLTLIPLSLISTAYDPVFRAYPDHLPFLIKTRFLLLAPLLAGLWSLTDRFGLVGAIAVVIGVNAIERLVIAWKAAGILEVSWRDLVLLKDVAKLLLCAFAAALASVLARNFMPGTGPLGVLALSGTVYGLVYLSLVFLSGVLAREERDALREAVETVQEYAGFAK